MAKDKQLAPPFFRANRGRDRATMGAATLATPVILTPANSPEQPATTIPQDIFDPEEFAPASSSVHTQETNPPLTNVPLLTDYDPPRDEFRVTPIDTLEATFRHSGWSNRRAKVWASLKSAGANSNRLDAFANCGSAAYVQYSPSAERFRLSANYCHDRFCLKCGEARSNKIAAALAAAVKGKTVRFLTLTQKHNSNPLAEQITRLLTCFSILRRRKWWKANVTGGAAFLEIKYKPETRQWHPHLHIVATGQWMPAKELSAEWYAVTGDSYIVDVRAVRDEKELTRYVCKYASKPMDSSIYACREALIELIVSLKGRRLCTTFGTWRGLDLDGGSDDPADWSPVGSLRDLIADAKRGDRGALTVLAQLVKGKPPAEVAASLPGGSP